MKIVNITLGRDPGYTSTVKALACSAWKATVQVDEGNTYPADKTIPADIAQAMADAAYAELVKSGFFTPSFDSVPVERDIARAPQEVIPLADPTPDLV